MKNNSAEWQREFYLTHDKYRMQGQGTDCYKVVKSLTRILQLPTIAKLTTDNESVISDFRLNRGEYGLEPYDEYAIKVDDTYGASFYILVHRRVDTTFLCPILVDFEGENTCAMVMPTDNWRMREMTAFVELRRAEKEFGVDGLMMAVNTRNGVYGCLSVLNESGNLLERWLRTERDSLHERNTVTAPSSAALILQIWLHTICLWKRRCLSRKVEQRVVHANGEQESVKDVRECLNTSKQTIVDLKKGIVVFIPALDVEVDVQRNPDASVQNGSVPEVGDIATVQIVLENGDYAVTAATFVPLQDIREDIPVTDDDFFDDDLDDEKAEEYDWYNEPPADDFGNLDID